MVQNQATFEKGNSPQGAERAARPWWEALFNPKDPLAYFPMLFVLILLFLGSYIQLARPALDAHLYACYSLVFWQGQHGLDQVSQYQQCHFLAASGTAGYPVQAFHILPSEYPPLTLLIYSPALLLPLRYYPYTFALCMALVALLIYTLLLFYGPRGSALVCAVLLAIGAFGTAEGRYDLVPALFTLLCVIAADRKRWTLAYVFLAFGVLLKIYPIVLFPALFMAEQIDARRFHSPPARLPLSRYPKELWLTLRDVLRWRWKHTLLFFVLILGVTAIFALLNFQNAVISQLSYFAQRPIQIESTGSTLLWLGRYLGYPASVVYGFGSVNFASDLTKVIAPFFEVLLIAGYVLTLLRQWQGKLDLTRACIMLTLVFIVMGKVFSPQYLIWVIPLLAYSGAFKRIWLILWALIGGLTTYIFPFMYLRTKQSYFLPETHYFLQAVALRNALLLFVTVAFLFNWFGVTWPREEGSLPLPAPQSGLEDQDTLPLPVPTKSKL